MTLFPGPLGTPHQRPHMLKAHLTLILPHSSVWKECIKTVPSPHIARVMQCGYKCVTLDLEHELRHEHWGPKLRSKEVLHTSHCKRTVLRSVSFLQRVVKLVKENLSTINYHLLYLHNGKEDGVMRVGRERGQETSVQRGARDSRERTISSHPLEEVALYLLLPD